MKLSILMALMAASLSSVVFSDSYSQEYSPGTGRDPRLRAAYFNARTHRPFDALTEAAAAEQKMGGQLAISNEMVAAFKLAIAELGLGVDDVGVSILSAANVDGLQAPQSHLYENYNRGVSLLKSPSPQDGVQILTAISTGEYGENDNLLLQDKANLSLGYYYIEAGDNVAAINYFRQVRRLSSYANKALVGLGWALLSPNTQRNKVGFAAQSESDVVVSDYLWSGSEDDIAWSRRESPFRRAWAVAKGEKEKDLRAAMVPWMELISRDPLDPAVQEVMLIIPYLMLHWDGQEPRAQQYYTSAVERLKQAITDLDVIEEDIRSGGLIKSIRSADEAEDNGWNIWLSDLTAKRMGGYLSLILDAPGFSEALGEFRQLDRIYTRLNSAIEGSGGGVNKDKSQRLLLEVEDHRSYWSAALEKIALEKIAERRRRTEAYSAEAEFALARNYERLRQQLSSVVWSENES
ncbi:Uncharacterised protein [Zhongshania aliphaticivorans]|uniref:Beta-barrel assembly-enhancing protease n=1 Tax=Zhongshania aliphaticivorans TaxID=1470434 RepID=A0A5S9NVU7_9GAMM|nr:hypothetical protein [Zhongshania aliphaticivorans]CAA0094820.1 Uncharacterised protein [Zhongshania aliphaticivorans]CAA0112706.1 Uncharacterised protein [Zhongshania aliphaticivorans]